MGKLTYSHTKENYLAFWKSAFWKRKPIDLHNIVEFQNNYAEWEKQAGKRIYMVWSIYVLIVENAK